MHHFVKKRVQKKKFSKTGIVINLIFIILPIIFLGQVWVNMNESALKEICKIILGLLSGVSILHLVGRLLMNRNVFDIRNSGYEAETIDLYQDHIVIHEHVEYRNGKHYYDHCDIYFEDIHVTYLNKYQLKIYPKGKQSGKSAIKNYSYRADFLVQLEGYPEELIRILLSKYKDRMKIVDNT